MRRKLRPDHNTVQGLIEAKQILLHALVTRGEKGAQCTLTLSCLGFNKLFTKLCYCVQGGHDCMVRFVLVTKILKKDEVIT